MLTKSSMIRTHTWLSFKIIRLSVMNITCYEVMQIPDWNYFFIFAVLQTNSRDSNFSIRTCLFKEIKARLIERPKVINQQCKVKIRFLCGKFHLCNLLCTLYPIRYRHNFAALYFDCIIVLYRFSIQLPIVFTVIRIWISQWHCSNPAT